MKTIRRILMAFALVYSAGVFANDVKVVSGNSGDVTITEDNEMVQVSILNVEKLSYTLFIYSENGDLLYKGKLGNGQSLGRTFDFRDAQSGKYKFKMVSETGKTSIYRVQTGS